MAFISNVVPDDFDEMDDEDFEAAWQTNGYGPSSAMSMNDGQNHSRPNSSTSTSGGKKSGRSKNRGGRGRPRQPPVPAADVCAQLEQAIQRGDVPAVEKIVCEGKEKAGWVK